MTIRRTPSYYISPIILSTLLLLGGCESAGAGNTSGRETLSESATETGSENLSEGISEEYGESVFETAGGWNEMTEEEETEAPRPVNGSPVIADHIMNDEINAEGEDTSEAEGRSLIPKVFGWEYLSPILLPWNAPSEEQPAGFGHSIALLSYSLDQMLETFDGTWSVCVRDLQTGEQLLINDVAMPSASEMKLFILGCVYEDIRTGALERTGELVEWMYNMIRVSSNESANRILQTMGNGDYAAGIEHVNAYIRAAGYSENTHAYNPFNDPSIVVNPEQTNQTSAADVAELLERIYRRQFATHTACNEAEQLMTEQEIRFKIPSVIPDNCIVANKTGETDTIENDAALVFTHSGDYIITVFSTEWADKKTAQERIKAISAEVYAWHDDPEYALRLFPWLK